MRTISEMKERNNNMISRKVGKHKKRRKLNVVLMFILSLAVFLSMPLSVLADVISSGNTTFNVNHVRQLGQSQTTFASQMPISSIYLDMTRMSDDKMAIFTKLTNEPGIVLKKSFDSYSNVAVFDPSQQGASILNGASINHIAGGDTLFSFTYKDAAILPNGGRADVVFTYSNLYINTDVRLDGTSANGDTAWPTDPDVKPQIGLAAGRHLIAKNSCTAEYSTTLTQSQKEASGNLRTGDKTYATLAVLGSGVTMDVNISVVDSNGDKIDGNFLVPMTGINVGRTGQGATSAIYKTGDNDSFSESIRVNAGNVSDIYVRPNNNAVEPVSANNSGASEAQRRGYYSKIALKPTGAYLDAIKFTGHNTDNAFKNGTNYYYNSGFITTANASKGISMTSFQGGTSTNGYDTFYLSGDAIWHRIKSSTTYGGTIQTSTNGNANGKLNDGGTKLDPGTYTIPDGKSVVYTMKPNEGYVLEDIEVYDEIGRNGTDVMGNFNAAAMKPGDTKRVAVKTREVSVNGNVSAGTTNATLTCNADGSYTFEFPENSEHHTIHVAWTPKPAVVKAEKNWDDFQNDYDTRQDVTLHLDAIGVYVDRNGRVVQKDYLDVLPPQNISKSASTASDLTKIWGNGVDKDGNPSSLSSLPNKDNARNSNGSTGNDIFYDFRMIFPGG